MEDPQPIPSAAARPHRWPLWLALALFLTGLAYNFALLEADRLPFQINGTSLGDEMAFAHSARVKYLHGAWFRPGLDDWRPIFLVPLHSFLVWLGFEVFGLTLTGLRAHAFFFMALSKGLICYLVWREYKKTSYLVLSLLLVSLLPAMNEMSRTGAVDSPQTGLIALSLFLMVTARDGQTRARHLLAGAFCGLAFCYKLSAFLWPLFPYVYLHLRWRLGQAPAPAYPGAVAPDAPGRPWARWLLLYAPTLYLFLDASLLGSDRSFNLGLLLWPLLPLLYLDAGLGLSAWRAWRGGQERGRWGLFWWLALNLGLWGLLGAKALAASPGQGLMLLRNLLPLVAALGFVHATWLKHGWQGLACGDAPALGWTHLGLGLVLGLAALFWIIPHLDGAMYFSWRMFGTSGRLLPPAHIRELAGHVLDLLGQKGSLAAGHGVLSLHSAWVFGLLAWVLLLALRRRGGHGDLDLALMAGAGLFFFQCIMYDMSWHRYYALMPLGYLGLLKLAHAARAWRSWDLPPRPGPLAWLVFAYVFYLLAGRLVHPLPFGQAAQMFWPMAGLLLLGALLYWLILRLKLRAALLALGLAGLLLLPVNLRFAWSYFSDVTHTVRQASLELGQKIGEARTPGFYELSLYNRTEAGYIGNFRGQVKPDGFFWEGRHVDSLYQAVRDERHSKPSARLLWFLDGLYPGFLKAWELPPDFRERFHSDWLLHTPDRPSPRHLVIGASKPVVYLQKELYDFFLERSFSAPALTGEVVTVPRPRNQMDDIPQDGEHRPFRLVRLDPTRRVPGGLAK
ncbi:MAG: glycosyltransferase family 39 protein [Desulfarculus sp.]|nr:glycosyltransferase family 39 protein [Desulfarculus sp.]